MGFSSIKRSIEYTATFALISLTCLFNHFRSSIGFSTLLQKEVYSGGLRRTIATESKDRHVRRKGKQLCIRVHNNASDAKSCSPPNDSQTGPTMGCSLLVFYDSTLKTTALNLQPRTPRLQIFGSCGKVSTFLPSFRALLSFQGWKINFSSNCKNNWDYYYFKSLLLSIYKKISDFLEILVFFAFVYRSMLSLFFNFLIYMRFSGFYRYYSTIIKDKIFYLTLFNQI